MSTLLRRLSINLERRMGLSEDTEPHSARTMPATASFNDFSMHIGQEVDTHIETSEPTQKAPAPGNHHSVDLRPSPFTVGSAPAATGMPTKALTIPRTSVAHILMRDPSSSTPRSFLDMPPSSSVPTPRQSLGSEEPSSPRSPKSPTTPGGRRRRQQKIHGMDYYEFCELVRAGSL